MTLVLDMVEQSMTLDNCWRSSQMISTVSARRHYESSMVRQASIASLMDITSSLSPHYMVKLAEIATSEVISPKVERSDFWDTVFSASVDKREFWGFVKLFRRYRFYYGYGFALLPDWSFTPSGGLFVEYLVKADTVCEAELRAVCEKSSSTTCSVWVFSLVSKLYRAVDEGVIMPPAFPSETPGSIKEFVKEKYRLPRLDLDEFSPEKAGRQWKFNWFDRAEVAWSHHCSALLSFPHGNYLLDVQRGSLKNGNLVRCSVLGGMYQNLLQEPRILVLCHAFLDLATDFVKGSINNHPFHPRGLDDSESFGMIVPDDASNGEWVWEVLNGGPALALPPSFKEGLDFGDLKKAHHFSWNIYEGQSATENTSEVSWSVVALQKNFDAIGGQFYDAADWFGKVISLKFYCLCFSYVFYRTRICFRFILKEHVRKSMGECQLEPANEALERFRHGSKKTVLRLVDMESLDRTLDFFRKLSQEVKKGRNPAASPIDRCREGHFRR
ncbi:unnamed protein product [Ilex paraguariensis]|uniref:Uncharacterized protein n=1 Tax=Ilex paraguariensis TaxID=185542 RepID=A0ABC8T818_9AQUA